MKHLTILILWMIPFTHAFAQMYDGEPCECCGNDALRNIDSSHTHDWVITVAEFGGYAGMSSSFLKPYGTPPPLPDGNETYPEDAEDKLIKNHKWTCMYSAYSLTDDDTTTAWVEGVEGDGEGEVIIPDPEKISTSSPLEIYIGYGKSRELYKSNARPKDVEVYLLRANEIHAFQLGIALAEFNVIGSEKMTLEDKMGYQSISVPAYIGLMNEKGMFLIAIKIISVYPGKKYKDTCISEIREKE